MIRLAGVLEQLQPFNTGLTATYSVIFGRLGPFQNIGPTVLTITSESLPVSDRDWIFPLVGRDAVSLLRGAPAQPLTRRECESTFGVLSAEVHLGQWQGQDCYSAQVAPERIDPLEHLQGNLYTLIGRVPDDLFAAWGRAVQLQSWLRDHAYCGRCGAPTETADLGRALSCSACEHNQYPRLSPCVIVAITRGEQLLLAAAQHRRAAFYSTLAGFIEPGESAEQAVVREVYEEVGLSVGNLRYFGSQPWPFPGQLMLGFYADYLDGDIRLDEQELSDAGWFSANQLPPIPPATSISGQLIRQFFHSQNS